VSIDVGGADAVPTSRPDSSPAVTSSVSPSPTQAPSGATPATPPPAANAAPARSGSVLAAPGVRRMAAEKGIDLSTVRGSGPGGRILESDLTAPPPTPVVAAAPPPAAKPESPGVAPPSPPVGPTKAADHPPSAEAVALAADIAERVPIRGVRRIIAEHMAEATHRAAHFTYVEEVDAGELMRVRDRMARSIEKDGLKLSYLPFIVKAVVAGLRAHPWMNARMDDEHQELVLHKGYHIGIATAAPEGLIVPVVRHAETKSVAHLTREIADLSERGRAGKLQRSELVNGTFTITSLGALGGVLATPILNYPEVAILGVHRIAKRPGYLPDGSIGPVHLMNLSVSLDHRVLDGIVGAQFLAIVKANLEDPAQMFAHLA
jgi:pyruvate dehydrogenase E2 component (dihydrolipoamide acetyltransferase)